MGFLKGWVLWILMIAIGLLGWQVILWLLNRTKLTEGIGKTAAELTGTGDGKL